MRMRQPQLDEITFDEAMRYWRNARDLLASCEASENGFYLDMKPVREAFGTAWLAVDIAIKAALSRAGMTKFPKSWPTLFDAAARELSVRNGRLIRDLGNAYEQIHQSGYYYAGLRAQPAAQGALDVARRIIERLSGQSVN